MAGFLLFLTRYALRILATVAAVILLVVGAMLVTTYLRAQDGTPVTATYGACSSHTVFDTGTTTHSARSHQVWDCAATWTLDGSEHHTTVHNLNHGKSVGQTASGYAVGNDLLFTSKGQFGAGIGLLAGGVVVAGLAVWLWLRGRRPKVTAPTEWAAPA